jgi:pyruvate dehydrogenase E2 component (dihydrolipoamide acetyltransferase)
MSEKKSSIISASPKVRKLARELGADLHLIKGSQREGRVNEDDIKIFVKKSLSEEALKNKEFIKSS